MLVPRIVQKKVILLVTCVRVRNNTIVRTHEEELGEAFHALEKEVFCSRPPWTRRLRGRAGCCLSIFFHFGEIRGWVRSNIFGFLLASHADLGIRLERDAIRLQRTSTHSGAYMAKFLFRSLLEAIYFFVMIITVFLLSIVILIV